MQVSQDERERWISAFLDCIEKSQISYVGLLTESPIETAIKLLKQRLENSKKSFLLLYKNKQYFDAMNIVGYMFELSANISHIEKNKNKEKTINKLYASVAFQNFYRILSVSPESNCQDWNKSFDFTLNQLKQYGSSI